MPTIVALGVVYLAVTLGMLLNPALRRLDTSRTEPPSGRAETAAAGAAGDQTGPHE